MGAARWILRDSASAKLSFLWRPDSFATLLISLACRPKLCWPSTVTSSAALEACLRGPHGARLSCARAPARKPKKGKDGKPVKLPKLSNEQRAARLVEAFHQQCLAMPLGLTGTDLNSLDGSTTVAEQAVRRKLGGILDMAIKERK